MSNFAFVAHALGLPTGPGGKPAAAAPAPVPTADQPTKEQLVELFSLLRLTPLFEAANNGMPTQITLGFGKLEMDFFIDNPPITTAREATADQINAQYHTLAETAYPLSAMEDDIAGVYQSYLSADDVAAANAFFGSPAGQHLLDSQPAMLLAMPVVADKLQQVTEDMQGKFYAALVAALGTQEKT
jgi:Uncharacterized protein conserved in bacteria (DUF2059)